MCIKKVINPYSFSFSCYTGFSVSRKIGCIYLGKGGVLFHAADGTYVKLVDRAAAALPFNLSVHFGEINDIFQYLGSEGKAELVVKLGAQNRF